MNGFGSRRNASLYAGRHDPRSLRAGGGIILPAGYARSSNFGVIPIQVPPRADPYLRVPYGYSPSGVHLIPAGVPLTAGLRNYEHFGGLGDAPSPHSHSHIEPWRPRRLAVSNNSIPCGADSATLGYQYDTKDIVVRGKAKVIRQSYLHESPKFEAELVKYLDKKSKEQIPEHVVDALITFINSNQYGIMGIVDEVTLNILGHNIGCKSVVDASMSHLKMLDFQDIQELGEVTAMILMCTKVDSGLKGWLKKYLEKDDCYRADSLLRDLGFLSLIDDRPEILPELRRLVGVLPAPKDDKYRSL